MDIYRKHIELLKQLCQKQVGKKINLSNGIIAIRGYDNIILQKVVGQDIHLDKQEVWNPLSIDLSSMKIGKNNVFNWVLIYVISMEYGIKQKKICLQLVDKKEIKNIYSNNVYTKFFDCDKISRKIDIRFGEQGILFGFMLMEAKRN